MSKRSPASADSSAPLALKIDAQGRIWSPLRGTWLVGTPEERVRQEYVCALVNEYGYALAQMAEEKSVAGKRGTAAAKADILLWRTPAAKAADEHALIVVECKADNVTIDPEVYTQGSHYAQYEQARFFVAHNNRQTKVFKVDLAKRAPNYSEIQDLPHADATDRRSRKFSPSSKPSRSMNSPTCSTNATTSSATASISTPPPLSTRSPKFFS